MFETKPTMDPTLSKAKKEGLEKYLLVLAKKHMPREYVEGQIKGGPGRCSIQQCSLLEQIIKLPIPTVL